MMTDSLVVIDLTTHYTRGDTMWQTDTVTIQISTPTKVRGATKTVWADDEDVLCDVQDMNKEFAFKNYGVTSEGEIKRVFDQTLNTKWKKHNQVKFEGKQYWIKYVNGNKAKMGASNHVFILLAEVI